MIHHLQAWHSWHDSQSSEGSLSTTSFPKMGGQPHVGEGSTVLWVRHCWKPHQEEPMTIKMDSLPPPPCLRSQEKTVFIPIPPCLLL